MISSWYPHDVPTLYPSNWIPYDIPIIFPLDPIAKSPLSTPPWGRRSPNIHQYPSISHIRRWHPNDIPPFNMGLSENSVPLHPMVLLIIIPTKWLFHWGYTPFSDIPTSHSNLFLVSRWQSREIARMGCLVLVFTLPKIPPNQTLVGSVGSTGRDWNGTWDSPQIAPTI
jgi:hypothetical protein